MPNYKIVVQYDGTKYKGWQGQHTTDLTIQGKIETVLSTLALEPVKLTGSGRTDAGVHALGQVANFKLQKEMTCESILKYLNEYLPEDIGIISIENVPERFHSRYHAVSKTYCYRIHNSAIPNVFERKYAYNYQTPLNVERMRQGAQYLLGTHDFCSFCGNKKMKKSTIRTISEIRIEKLAQEIRIYYTGDGFLQNMVRIITGTLIEIGDGRRSPEEMKEILEAKDRGRAGYTAPACGLALMEVRYEE